MGYRVADKQTFEKWSELDWQKAPGITERGKLGTNWGLAERDYSIRCETGSEPICVINGTWLWYCTTHHQPESHCQIRKSENELTRLKTDVIEAIKSAPGLRTVTK